jgi:hypothetical protein
MGRMHSTHVLGILRIELESLRAHPSRTLLSTSGVAFGTYPARLAARLTPVEAIQRE